MKNKALFLTIRSRLKGRNESGRFALVARSRQHMTHAFLAMQIARLGAGRPSQVSRLSSGLRKSERE